MPVVVEKQKTEVEDRTVRSFLLLHMYQVLKLHHAFVTLRHSKSCVLQRTLLVVAISYGRYAAVVSGTTAEALQQTIVYLTELYLYVLRVRSTSKYLYCAERCASCCHNITHENTVTQESVCPCWSYYCTGWETPHTPYPRGAQLHRKVIAQTTCRPRGFCAAAHYSHGLLAVERAETYDTT